jgi:hypothetical protein
MKQTMHQCTLPKEKCKALYNRILLALDGSLSYTDEQVLYDEVKAHACCFDKMDKQRAYKEYVKTRLQRKHVPEEIIIEIRNKIMAMSNGNAI